MLFTLESAPTKSENPGMPILWTKSSKTVMCLCFDWSSSAIFFALLSESSPISPEKAGRSGHH